MKRILCFLRRHHTDACIQEYEINENGIDLLHTHVCLVCHRREVKPSEPVEMEMNSILREILGNKRRIPTESKPEWLH